MAAIQQMAGALVQFAQKAVIFDAADRVLLVARLGAGGQFVRWELPGGRVEAQEDLDAGLRREIWEEVGLDVIPGRPVHLWTWTAADGAQIVAAARTVLGRSGHVTERHRPEGEGLGEIRWMPLTQVPTADMDDASRKAISDAVDMRDENPARLA